MIYYYYLMNKNRKLLKFSIENFPLGERILLSETYSDALPVGFKDIHMWLDNRNYAKHKEHFRKWLTEWGINTIRGFIETTH